MYAWAAAEEAQHRLAKAHDLYVRAVDLQPLNSDAWYELGLFDSEVLRHRAAAIHALQRAADLDGDPNGRARQALDDLTR